MLNKNRVIVILCKDGSKTKFQITGRDIVPYSNFKLAEKWYIEDKLTAESKVIIDDILDKLFSDFLVRDEASPILQK